MRALAVIAATLLLALGAHAAPSFDCDRAKSSTEQLICGEPAGVPSLQWFDRQLARLFGLALRQTYGQAREQLVAEQRRFIVTRDACGREYECVLKAYERRLLALAPRLNVFEAYANYSRTKHWGARIWIVRFGLDAGVLVSASGANYHLCGFETDSAQVGGKGVIRWRGRGADACRIDIVPEGDGMRLETRNCEHYCGARAEMDGLYTRVP